eukprot:COSAG02_NODE_10620_length_1899_cov_1.294444_2_plen_378_part_00
MGQLGGAGSTLRFEDVTIPEYHYDPAQTVAITVNEDGTETSEGSLSFGRPMFDVSSGPCTVSQGGLCVGRAQGYGVNEECAITVSGGGGTLAACSVFDVCPASDDFITLPGGAKHRASDCPVGVALATGNTVAFASDGICQGSVGYPSFDAMMDCGATGTCGLPHSYYGLGGGWEICFVPPVPGCTNPTASDFNPAATVEDGSCTSGTPLQMGVKFKTFPSWRGMGTAGLTSSPAYLADTPTPTVFLTPPALFEEEVITPVVMWLTTYFLAPQSGDYIFVVLADDVGELWLGRDESTLQLIASCPQVAFAGEWNKYPQQASAPQRLEAGSYYMLQALGGNGLGRGLVAVGVTLPDGEELRPIPVLGYLFDPPPTIHG